MPGSIIEPDSLLRWLWVSAFLSLCGSLMLEGILGINLFKLLESGPKLDDLIDYVLNSGGFSFSSSCLLWFGAPSLLVGGDELDRGTKFSWAELIGCKVSCF